jgi:hypothetical protein
MEKKRVVKPVIIALIILLGIFIIWKCAVGKASAVYSYNMQKIEHSDFFYISRTAYFDDRVEFKVSGEPVPEQLYYSTPDDAEAKVDTKSDTVILYSDHPEDITSLEVSNSWYKLSFRYLNTKEYACIWTTWADDLGGVNYSGATDRYYTEEEKEQQREAAERAREQREQARKEDEELFPVFEGAWMSDDGDYFEISDNGSGHRVKYYCAATQVAEEHDGFVFSRWQENAYQMSYSEGSWGLFLTYDIEYLGEDFFLCFGKKFYKADEQAQLQEKQYTREYFETLDKESSLEDIVADLGNYGIEGSGILYHVWHLDDGTEAKVVFDSEGRIVMIYIVSEDQSERIYKREY